MLSIENHFSSFLVALIGLLTFVPAIYLDFEYVSDDSWMLLNNSNIWNTDLLYVLKSVFTSFDYGQYSPLNTIFYRIVFFCVGMKPLVFHSINVIFHAANCLLVYRLAGLLWKTYKPKIQAKPSQVLVTSILFAVHPAHAEAISWISASKIVLCTFFSLLALIYYVKWLKSKNNSHKLLVYLFIFLAFGFKEQVIILPLIFTLVELLRKSPAIEIFKNQFFFYIFSLIGFLWTYLGYKTVLYSGVSKIKIDFLENLGMSSYCLLRYLANFILPVDLKVRYQHLELGQYSAIGGIMIVLIPLIFGLKRSPFKLDIIDKFGIFFFLLSIICFINIVPLPRPSIIADRYLYFASIGLCLVFGNLFVKFSDSKIFTTFYIVFILFLASSAFIRCMNWSFEI